MKFFQGFLHFNIRCAEEDLPAIEKFYGDVLDLKSGPRPNFNAPGMWLYYGDDPILHVGARFKKARRSRTITAAASITSPGKPPARWIFASA